jgi:manganese/iron transport system ATP-binding protein
MMLSSWLLLVRTALAAISSNPMLNSNVSTAITAMTQSNLVLQNLTVTYQSVQALRNVSVTIAPGQLVGIFGPNGAGKSTLVKAMLGLVPATMGTVHYGDRPLTQQRSRVSYVPQRSNIDWQFPATVWDVVLMGRVQKAGLFSRLSTVSRRMALQALERVGMADYRNRRIGDLSGGQQQRVFLARSLTQEAEIFIFDEPFVGVDQVTEQILFNIFRELAGQGSIVMVVNHDLGESITHFDRLLLLNRELIAYGDRRSVLQPEPMSRAYGGHVRFFADQRVS